MKSSRWHPEDKPEYSLSPSSSVAEILEVLRALKNDARNQASECAYYAFIHQSKHARLLTAGYEGKRRIIDRILVALDGTLESEGTESKVNVNYY